MEIFALTRNKMSPRFVDRELTENKNLTENFSQYGKISRGTSK